MMTREIKSRVAITQPKAKAATSGGKIAIYIFTSFSQFLKSYSDQQFIGSETTKLGPSKAGGSKKLTEKKNGCC
jgi:hypothetical protein